MTEIYVLFETYEHEAELLQSEHGAFAHWQTAKKAAYELAPEGSQEVIGDERFPIFCLKHGSFSVGLKVLKVNYAQ